VRRREFITATFAAAMWPLASLSQQLDRVHRLAVLLNGAPDDAGAKPRLDAFLEALMDLGWTEGKNLQVDVRWGRSDPGLIGNNAVELLKLNPDAVLAATSTVVAAVKKETTTIPVVFVVVSDPEGQGFVRTVAHPEGNITGFTALEYSFGPKWLQLLKECAPDVARVLVIFNPKTMATVARSWLAPLIATAPSLGITVAEGPGQDMAELEANVMAFARDRNGGLLVLPDPFTTARRAEVVALAARYRVPTIYAFRAFGVSGGLLSYGPDLADIFRRGAVYIDRILRGENPGDLPVQEPTKFELLINLKTAKVLGLTIPPGLLARADEVIE
jgi:putative tryptophan/tyrosine transport system substrate-binding protein